MKTIGWTEGNVPDPQRMNHHHHHSELNICEISVNNYTGASIRGPQRMNPQDGSRSRDLSFSPTRKLPYLVLHLSDGPA